VRWLIGCPRAAPSRIFFGLAPLAFAEWSILLFFPPTVLLLEEGREWIIRRTR
jgi:hypothetical protein